MAFLNDDFWRVKIHDGDIEGFPAWSAKTSNLYLQMWLKTFARRILFKSCRFRFRFFVFGLLCHHTASPPITSGKKSFFPLTHCRVLPVWVEESWSARKLGHASILAVKSHWTMNISTNSFRITKSFEWLLNNFVRFSLNFHIWLQQSNLRIAPGAKSTFGPIWVRTGPENLKNLIGSLTAVALIWSKVQAKDLRKLH